jgi:hypothetical protein
MADRDEVLRNSTHKGDENLARRVFYTLENEKQTAKAVGLLVKHLHARKLISDEEIDEMLLEVVD